jgi:quinol monooxygenase YgiN
MFLRIVEGKARPGKVHDIENLWARYAEEVVKKLKGFLFVQILSSGDDIMAVSSWRTREDMEAYLELEEAKALYRELPSLLMGVPTIRTYNVLRTVIGEEVAGTDAAQWLRG